MKSPENCYAVEFYTDDGSDCRYTVYVPMWIGSEEQAEEAARAMLRGMLELADEYTEAGR